ncbi:MAG: TonB-dependent receptor [Caulobacterales bacterium]
MARRFFERSRLASVPLMAALLAPASALAADASPGPATTAADVVVTARKLDAARDTVEPSLGASTYTVTSENIEKLPGGDNVSLSQVILQMPGVSQDSFGQLHVRDDHANLQYRLNNVIIPEGLSVFGQVLSPRLIGDVQLITGAVPAQYGLRTAAILNITTKTGQYRNGGTASIYGGSHGEIEPSIEYSGSSGGTNVFVSASYLGSNLGIESPDGSGDPLHDHTDQIQGFGYLEHIIDMQSRLSLILGTSDESFQIPDSRGLNAVTDGFGVKHGLPPLVVDGVSNFPSEQLNASQRENTQFAILSYQHTTDKFTLQASAFARYSTLTYHPDFLGELLFSGIAQYAAKTDLAGGLQVEGVYDLTAQHTLRAGAVVSVDRATSYTNSAVLAELGTDGMGKPIYATTPSFILDSSAKSQLEASVYVEDEWKPIDALTVNFGLRFDQVNAYRNENVLSPRLNLVWTPLEGTTLHAGYARYYTPPPFELVAAQSVAAFNATTAQPAVTQDDAPRGETDNYYDVGAQQKFRGFTLGVDGYWRDAKNLIDEGQFGAPIILTPFNYQVGKIRGVELSATYDHGPFSAWANVAYETAKGQHIISSQFNFTQAELDYITSNFIYLDHDQTLTASGGASYQWGPLKLATDFIYGSGLRRTPLGAPPNSGHVPGYWQVNLNSTYEFPTGGDKPLSLRFDVINLFDEQYEIRDGTGVGVGAPQWGPRRGFFVGLEKTF